MPARSHRPVANRENASSRMRCRKTPRRIGTANRFCVKDPVEDRGAGIELTPGERSRLPGVRTISPAAFDAYL